MSEGFNGKPKSIKEAMLAGDTERLSAAGRKGAEVANENRARAADEVATLEQIALEKAAIEEAELRRSTNEDILSADGEDFDIAPENRI